ncbi:alpha-L-rhamnosidase [Glutamicibacter halophytocola]|uniref:alpha-L-rhamnosidase n=1 Tax=Glutamicibacter halophytocola TaxID=1933880 RepID=UPI0015C55195|nr:alpha-L-rhamnosidase [Glutamicibacter halophytocola]NQD42063.1 family 78 glycoside hydrolase catalytic domain [Glutamicibacter halophytocola]
MNIHVRPATIEHHRDPMGIGESAPRLSWITDTAIPGWSQRAYEVQISDPATGALETTGQVLSAQQVLVPWPARELSSRETRTVRVRVWGADPDPSPWSEPAILETGLLDSSLFSAQAISPQLPPAGSEGEPAALLRGEIDLAAPVAEHGKILSARLRATARGVMTLHLNGTTVGEDALNPGWSSYAKRLRYRTWDVTKALRPGANALGVHLADGWYRGFLGFGGLRGLYGDATAAWVQLEVQHADGTCTIGGTDGTWRSTLGPVTRADIYKGQSTDARRRQHGWDEPGFDDSSWTPVAVQDLDPAILIAPDGPAVRPTQLVPAARKLSSPTGAVIVDFGQNLVGRLRVQAPAGFAGQAITFRHAEVLEDGELGTRPLRAASATDELILDGTAMEWEPEFTFHGFRYVQVDGWPTELDPAALQAVVLHTDMARTGGFSCSDGQLERLHENAVWSMRGNFLDVPTDCPQRDERLGWTGDLMAFAPSAAYLYDCAGMLTGWLADLAADQHPDGNVPVYIPWVDADPSMPPLGAEAGWGDAATVVPWTLYERFADPGILERQWDSMDRWVQALARRAGDQLDFASGGFSFGDWLDASAPDDQPWAARLPWQAVATAYLAQSARIMRDAAQVLGRGGDEKRYAGLFERCAQRYREEYATPSGRAAFPSQTAYALALRFGLLEPEQLEHAGQLLAAQVAEDGFRIGSGFLGTPHVCDALVDSGHAATMWRLLLQTECPSWLYAVGMGATTIWERWNSLLPDGSLNPGGMTSFNHYAFGAVADFLHRRVGGLAPAEPGYRRQRIAPVPTASLSWARAELQTPYGPASSSWTLREGVFELEVLVPPSTSAQIHLPDGSAPVEVASGRHRFSCAFQEQEAADTAPTFDAV